MDELQLKLCDIQGRLFELSAEKKYNSAVFVKTFMLSDTAKELDSRYNRMQWRAKNTFLRKVPLPQQGRLKKEGGYSLQMCYT